MPCSAPFLFGDSTLISMVGKSCGSTALVMEKVPLPLSGTRNVPADAAFPCPGLTYQHSYHFESPKFSRCCTVKVISQLPEASCRAVAVPEAACPDPGGGRSLKATGLLRETATEARQDEDGGDDGRRCCACDGEQARSARPAGEANDLGHARRAVRQPRSLAKRAGIWIASWMTDPRPLPGGPTGTLWIFVAVQSCAAAALPLGGLLPRARWRWCGLRARAVARQLAAGAGASGRAGRTRPRRPGSAGSR